MEGQQVAGFPVLAWLWRANLPQEGGESEQQPTVNEEDGSGEAFFFVAVDRKKNIFQRVHAPDGEYPYR